MHEIIFKKARGLPQITKKLTMCIFLHRCVGLRVDRGALSACAQTEIGLLGIGAQKNTVILAHVRTMRDCGPINPRTTDTRP
jgi:hypothetical protein